MRWMWGVAAVVGLVIVVAATTVLILSSDDTAIVDLEVGDCFDLALDDGANDVDSVRTISCDDPHEAEVVLAGDLNPEGDREYPADDALFAEIDALCRAVPAEITAEFGLLPIAPDLGSWESFGGRYLCVAIPFGGGTVTGSLAAG